MNFEVWRLDIVSSLFEFTQTVASVVCFGLVSDGGKYREAVC